MKDAFFETPSAGAFAGARLDRNAVRREDAAHVAAWRARDDARFALIVRDMPILGRDDDRAFWPASLADQLGVPQAEVLLGLDPAGVPHFAALLPDAAVDLVADPGEAGLMDRRKLVIPGRDDLTPTDMRSIAMQGLVAPNEVAILGLAKAIVSWHARHGFCAQCGQPTQVTAAGWRRECAACGTHHFPRTDPVVIMLAVDGENCLLGRQARFPKSMYSALAGFLEPGETVEEAVRREIFEESAIVCGPVRYVASQPWPFPSSLMIGALAQAKSREITVDKVELEDARWFAREEVVAMFERRHPQGLSAPHPLAIAHHLLRFWLTL